MWRRLKARIRRFLEIEGPPPPPSEVLTAMEVSMKAREALAARQPMDLVPREELEEYMTQTEERFTRLAELIATERQYFKSQIKYFINVAIQDFYKQEQRHIESRIIRLLRAHVVGLNAGKQASEIFEEQLDNMKKGTVDKDIPWTCDSDEVPVAKEEARLDKLAEAAEAAGIPMKANCRECETFTSDARHYSYGCAFVGNCPGLHSQGAVPA